MTLRSAGALIALAGAAVGLAVPVIGRPEGFWLLMLGAVVLWIAGAATAAGCVVPARPFAGTAAGLAALCAWGAFAWFDAAWAFRGVAAVAGALVAAFPDGPQRGGRGRSSDTTSDARA